MCATGFKVMEKGATPPFPCLGRGGTDLNTWWDENRYQAYQGVTVPGWPNAYMLIGPWAYSPGSYLVRITENSVITADGTEHEIDVLVCATGFKVMEKGATRSTPTICTTCASMAGRTARRRGGDDEPSR